MPIIAYEAWTPGERAALDVARANDICRDYAARGYTLTLRQVYYQFVSRDWIPNRQREYDRLGEVLNRARLAGMMDWAYMEDRTRELRGNQHWTSPTEIMNAVRASYRLDHWDGQPTRVEVWVEKDALVDVVARAAGTEDVNYFSCRGYTSQSEMWAAGQRHLRHLKAGRRVVVLHLGDHDPSGLQMSQDIEKRLYQFAARHLLDDLGRAKAIDILQNSYKVKRIALTPEQIAQYNPPPNPAKQSDSRYQWYVNETGLDESWELDALDPDVLNTLISSEVAKERPDNAALEKVLARERRERALLARASENWPDVVAFLEERFGAVVAASLPANDDDQTADPNRIMSTWQYDVDTSEAHWIQEPDADNPDQYVQTLCDQYLERVNLSDWASRDAVCASCRDLRDGVGPDDGA